MRVLRALKGLTLGEFTMIQERMVFEKYLPATAAITFDFTIPHEFTMIQERMVFKKTCPLQQQSPWTSQCPKIPAHNPRKPIRKLHKLHNYGKHFLRKPETTQNSLPDYSDLAPDSLENLCFLCLLVFSQVF